MLNAHDRAKTFRSCSLVQVQIFLARTNFVMKFKVAYSIALKYLNLLCWHSLSGDVGTEVMTAAGKDFAFC